MNPGISIRRVWSDEDVVEFSIAISDGISLFSNKVYVGHQDFDDSISQIEIFKSQVYEGLCNIQFGEFGLEYAGGAFYARLHFQSRGKIHIKIWAQSEFQEFGKELLASEASLFIVTEPALLDRFIGELKALNTGSTNEARLEGICEPRTTGCDRA